MSVAAAAAARSEAGLGFYLLRLSLHAGEADEDLLEGRLTDRVVVDVVRCTGALHGAEQPCPRQTLSTLDTVVHQPVVLVLPHQIINSLTVS